MINNLATYRKLNSANGWQDFVIDSKNKLYSAAGQQGICPSPNLNDYSVGLTQGHWCLMMLIEDGGANDDDSAANGTIVDPGSISEPLQAASLVMANIGNVVEGSSFNLTASVTRNGNEIVSYLWQQTGGPAATIANATVIQSPFCPKAGRAASASA